MNEEGFSPKAIQWNGPEPKERIHMRRTSNYLAVPVEFFREVPDLGAHTAVVYLAFLFHRNNQTGLAWPTLDTIVAETGVSKSKVRMAIAALQPKWLVYVRRRGRGKIYRVNGAFVSLTQRHSECYAPSEN